jgi:hypothetical protein
MSNKPIPRFVSPCLWFCNINKVDLLKDKQMIITQVLNYGNEKRVRWLYSVYSEKDIKNVVSHPGRGLWFDKVLNFWERMLSIHIPKKTRQKAIFDIAPAFSKR